ncbi:hypothetical protein MMC34_002899 [Xylographa carneopallida]|nr:hypothetical protein [Xylographa carneopallida]
MRLPYVPDPPPTQSAEDSAIVDRVRARRGSRGLTPLDRALLHAPAVADGWNSFLGAIRTKTSLPADIREIAICRVAVLNEAWYEWTHHAPIALAAGVNEAALESLKSGKAEGLDEKQMAVLEYTDAMTRGVRVPDAVFDKLRPLFTEREIVEITATVGAYNTVSRFLVALDVGEMNETNEH